MGHLLKSLKLYGKFIKINETLHILRRTIAAISLNILCKNLCSVECYDKANMRVCQLSLWENFSWCQTYFDQFMLTAYIHNYATQNMVFVCLNLQDARSPVFFIYFFELLMKCLYLVKTYFLLNSGLLLLY